MKPNKPDTEVFLVAGFVGDSPVINKNDPSDDNIVLAYLVAETPEAAIKEQETALPSFKATGIVSFAELKFICAELAEKAKDAAAGEDVYLVTGYTGGVASGKSIRRFHILEKSPELAVKKAEREYPTTFTTTGVVSFAEIKKHYEEFERITNDEAPYYNVPRT